MLDLSKFRDVHRRERSRGELFLADWLEKNRPTDADIKKLIRFFEEYRSHDVEDEEIDHCDYVLEADDEIFHVIPDVDDYWCNCIRDMFDDADLKRLRKCPSCGQWLYALDPRQKHCTAKCRDSVRMNTPSYRERKKEDMRNLRRIERERREKRRALKQ